MFAGISTFDSLVAFKVTHEDDSSQESTKERCKPSAEQTYPNHVEAERGERERKIKEELTKGKRRSRCKPR